VLLRLTAGIVVGVLIDVAAADAQVQAEVMGQAIPSITRVAHIPGTGDALSEARVVSPVLSGRLSTFGGRLQAIATVNFEGATLEDGELTPGAWGEGFNDRRHPHTYAHELMVTGSDLLGSLDGAGRVSISAGKGFVPYGSDDPMSRPIFRYPVNHHLAQILERAVLIGGIRQGPVLLEGALFNGDEPERPGQWPRISNRFGDSWAARLTVIPLDGIELSGSRAKVHSPEHRPGAGSDAHKWHLGARLDRPFYGTRVYALAEWARTEEFEGFFVFKTLLAEAAVTIGRHQPYYRFERTERPEDMRELDLFRSVRPHLENAILGVTRFTLHTVGYSHDLPVFASGSVAPFIEATVGKAENDGGGVLTPEILYGTEEVRSVSAGIRLSWRMRGHRMGRYGNLLDRSHHHEM
jgi:hypothetical protein